MKIDKHHICTGDDALSGDVHDVEYPVRTSEAAADRMRRIDANRHSGQALDDRDVGKIDQVSVRVTDVGLHTAKSEDDFLVALARQILGRVERFVQRDAESAFEQDRKLLLAADALEQLKILRVAGPDLQHYAGRRAGRIQSGTDLVDVRLVRDLHGDHLDTVFSGQIENVGQAIGPVTLKRVRTGPRLIGTHPRAGLTVFLQGSHHRLDALSRVNGAQAGENIQIFLTKRDAIVREVIGAAVVLMPAENAIDLGHAYDMFDAGKTLDLVDRQCGGVADQIQLGQKLLFALDIVDKYLDVLKIIDVRLDPPVFAAVGIDVWFENDDHKNLAAINVPAPTLLTNIVPVRGRQRQGHEPRREHRPFRPDLPERGRRDRNYIPRATRGSAGSRS